MKNRMVRVYVYGFVANIAWGSAVSAWAIEAGWWPVAALLLPLNVFNFALTPLVLFKAQLCEMHGIEWKFFETLNATLARIEATSRAPALIA
jgi:hypothetical protein